MACRKYQKELDWTVYLDHLHAIELADRVETFIHDVQALVNRKSEHVPKLDLMLPPSDLEEGKSNAILKVVPGDDKRHQVLYRQVRIRPS